MGMVHDGMVLVDGMGLVGARAGHLARASGADPSVPRQAAYTTSTAATVTGTRQPQGRQPQGRRAPG